MTSGFRQPRSGTQCNDFTYRSGSTSVDTRLPEVLERRTGVCQDFAHLMIGCARSMGLAARSVSGYIETRPLAGQPKLRGADASHAWAYRDVSPLRGIVFTDGGGSRLKVGVDLWPISADELPEQIEEVRDGAPQEEVPG